MSAPRDPRAGLVALTIGGALALNYPLLALFDRAASVLGVPLPFVHLFGVWALFIVGIACAVEQGERDEASASSGRPQPDE